MLHKLIPILALAITCHAHAQQGVSSLTCVADRFLGSVEGISFRDVYLLDDNTILAINTYRLYTYDISDPANIVQLSELDTPFDSRTVHYENGYAYLIDNSPGNLAIVDLQDPSNPSILSQTTIPNSSTYDYIIAIESTPTTTTAYLNGTGGDVLIFDVTDPAAPSLTTTANFLPAITRFEVSDSMLYIGASDLYIYDLTDPFNPAQRAVLTPTNWVASLLIDDNTLYMGDGFATISAVDISTPDSPTTIAELDVSVVPGILAMSNDNTLLAGGGANGVLAIDIADPLDMKILGHVLELGNLNAFASDETHIISARSNGLGIIDREQATTTQLAMSTNPLPDTAYDIAIEGNYAYVASNYDGVHIIDITFPLYPMPIAVAPNSNRAYKLDVDQGVLYVSALTSLEIFDVSDPTSPTHIAQIPDIKITGLDAQDDKLAIYSSEPGYVALYDIIDPSNPILLDTFQGPEYPEGVVLEGDKIHVAGGYTTFLTLDASDPSSLTLMGLFDAPGIVEFSYDINVVNDTAFVTSDFGYLYAIDITNPNLPQLISSTSVGNEPIELVIDGNSAIIGSLQNSTHMFDITDLSDITWTAGTLSRSNGSQIKDDYLYSAAASEGLFVIDIAECNRCPADFSGDGQLDFFDVNLFLIAFFRNQPEADLHNNGQFDFFDISAFLALYASGCT